MYTATVKRLTAWSWDWNFCHSYAVLCWSLSPWHGMSLSFRDGGDSLQIWKLAMNILNKQSQAAHKGWSGNWQGWVRA